MNREFVLGLMHLGLWIIGLSVCWNWNIIDRFDFVVVFTFTLMSSYFIIYAFLPNKRQLLESEHYD